MRTLCMCLFCVTAMPTTRKRAGDTWLTLSETYTGDIPRTSDPSLFYVVVDRYVVIVEAVDGGTKINVVQSHVCGGKAGNLAPSGNFQWHIVGHPHEDDAESWNAPDTEPRLYLFRISSCSVKVVIERSYRAIGRGAVTQPVKAPSSSGSSSEESEVDELEKGSDDEIPIPVQKSTSKKRKPSK